MSTVSPVVRSLIVCEEIITDPANVKRVTLVNLVNSIRSLADPPYPYRHAQLCVFVQLTECRGAAEVRVDIRAADADEVMFATLTRTVSFPNNPLTVHGLRFKIRNCQFVAPGLYWIQFWYNNHLLAQQPIILS